ncbi:MAG TPA: Hsp70 family protein, partial [Polyangiales bacterium]|nr:Hsp70 family protein [Polyangiales bacterium]
GGDDLDRALADRMVASFKAEHGIDLHREPRQYERLMMAAEWLKCQLSELDAAEATIREVVSTQGGAIDLTCRITRAELYELCSSLIGRTFSICEDALKLARVRPTQLDGVILVGGQTRTPLVRQMVADYFGMDPKYSVDPDLAVAQGAALQGYALSGAPALGERKVARTLLGPATAPPPASDPFEDEPTRIAAPRESRESDAAKRSETPFDDLPTTITERDTDAEMTKVGEVRVTQPSVKPDGVLGTHASTLAGVGAPAAELPGSPRRRPESEPVTVANETSHDASLVDEPIISISDGTGIHLEDEADYEFAHESIAELEEDEPEVLELPVASQRAPKTLAETPSAKAGMRPSRLPPDVRLTPPRPAGSAAFAPQPVAPPSAAVSNDDEDADLPAVLRGTGEEDPSTTLLERPRAKAKTRPPAPLAEPNLGPVDLPEEPIRTHSMARLLASQGHIERALSIYRVLHAQNPSDPLIATEARALLGQLASVGKAPSSKAPGPARASDANARSLPPPSATVTRPLRPSTESAKPARSTSAPDETPAPLHLAALIDDRAIPSIAPLRTLSPIPAPAPQNQQSQFPAPPGMAPLLLDVTPHTLCVETVGGFCEPIIERNAAIPTEQTRVFTTSRDNQVTVSVRVCQGESRHTDDNEVLGQIDLLGLRQARRGEVNIAVTFVIDADGTLNVRAIDEATGSGQEIEINLVGAIGAPEIERMRTRQRAAR